MSERWEYLREVVNWPMESEGDVLDKRGQEGWQLCAVTGEPTRPHFYFKRVKATAPRADQWTPEEMARFRMGQAINMCQGCFRPVGNCVCDTFRRTPP